MPVSLSQNFLCNPWTVCAHLYKTIHSLFYTTHENKSMKCGIQYEDSNNGIIITISDFTTVLLVKTYSNTENLYDEKL